MSLISSPTLQLYPEMLYKEKQISKMLCWPESLCHAGGRIDGRDVYLPVRFQPIETAIDTKAVTASVSGFICAVHLSHWVRLRQIISLHPGLCRCCYCSQNRGSLITVDTKCIQSAAQRQENPGCTILVLKDQEAIHHNHKVRATQHIS